MCHTYYTLLIDARRQSSASVSTGIDLISTPPDWSSRGGENQRQLKLKEPSFLIRDGDEQAFNQAVSFSSDGCASSDPTSEPSHP
jgi:hypothetical protein